MKSLYGFMDPANGMVTGALWAPLHCVGTTLFVPFVASPLCRSFCLCLVVAVRSGEANPCALSWDLCNSRVSSFNIAFFGLAEC